MKTTVGKFFEIVENHSEDREQFHQQMSIFPFNELYRDELLKVVGSIELNAKQIYLAKIYMLDWFLNSDDAEDDDGTFLTKLESVFDSRKDATTVRHMEDSIGRTP